jgi:hypothetical protein
MQKTDPTAMLNDNLNSMPSYQQTTPTMKLLANHSNQVSLMSSSQPAVHKTHPHENQFTNAAG